MKVINLSEQNSCLNQYMAELRDKSYQRSRPLFRNNIERIGQVMAYELSKTLTYKPRTVTTPLGTIDIPLLRSDDVIIATVLRAGLPFHDAAVPRRVHPHPRRVESRRAFQREKPEPCDS